jgi:hypothetical protein
MRCGRRDSRGENIAKLSDLLLGDAETALSEIEPHPLHNNFEIHGYLCDRCGPIKSLVVLRSGAPIFALH